MTKRDESVKKEGSDDVVAGVGIDLGTMNFVSARRVGKSGVRTSRIRNAFLDLPMEHKNMLKLSQKSFVELDGRLLVIGDEAIDTANLFNKEARRPMSGGMIAAGEIDAQQVIALMMKHTLGEPKTHGEKCFYSVPAPAIDIQGSDVTYHSAILGKILSELGYAAKPANEAQAIVYSECASDTFSGLGISFGAGMVNVCLTYNALNALEFSLGRSGDYIDQGAARAVNTTAAKICMIKENPEFDINHPKNREEEAIALFIQTLIDYVISNIIKQFTKVKNEILIPKPIPIVISGGTSLAKGFVEKFKEQFENYRSKFPVQISEIRAAKDPMTAVATGLLILAGMED